MPTRGETIHSQHTLPTLDQKAQAETSTTRTTHNACDRVDTPQISVHSVRPPTTQADGDSIQSGPVDNGDESGEREVDPGDGNDLFRYVSSPAPCLPDDDSDGLAFISSRQYELALGDIESRMSEIIDQLGHCQFKDVSSAHPNSYPSSVHAICKRLNYAFHEYTKKRVDMRRHLVQVVRHRACQRSASD